MTTTARMYNKTKTTQGFGNGQLLMPEAWGTVSLDTALRYLGDSRFQLDPTVLGELTRNRDKFGRIDSFTLASPWSISDGYGRVGTMSLLALQKKGFNIRPIQIGWRNEHGFTDEIRRAVADNLVLTKWGLIHGVPTELENVRTPYKALWTMWEGLTLPDSWAPLIRSYPNLPIIVPSSGQIEIFRRTGLDNPIYVVPDCIDPDSFTSCVRVAKRPEIFTVVSWSHMTARKCPLEMVDVFLEAFGSNPNVRLVLKTAGGKFGLMQGMIPEFKDPRITIVNALWSREQLQSFLEGAHAGLFLSRGEGFYLEPLEAALTGLPCVVPTHSGCADWAKEAYFYPVRTAGDEEAEKMGRNQRWWTMDYHHAAERLREIYDDYPKALAKAQKAGYWVRRNLNPEKTTETLVATLDKIDKAHG